MSTAVPCWAVAFLHEARVARLGTADAAGRPLVVPVCYAFDGEACYSAVDAKPKRTRNLRRLANITENPHASLVADEYDEDWTRLRYVIVEGRAEVLRQGDAFTRAVDLLVAKYPQYAQYGQYGTLALDRAAGVVIRLTAERVIAWKYAG